MDRKAQLGTLQNVILSVVVIAFLLGVGIVLVGKLADTTDDPKAKNATGEIKNSLADVVDWIPIIILSFIVVIVIGAIFLIARYRSQ
jgi:Na+/H+-dicarboxylate symporter